MVPRTNWVELSGSCLSGGSSAACHLLAWLPEEHVKGKPCKGAGSQVRGRAP